MVKKQWILFIIALMVLNLAACSGGSYRITVGKIGSSQNGLTGKYHSFTGYYFKKVKLREGETLSVTFTEKTEKGTLMAKVLDSTGKTIKTLNNGETLNLDHADEYKLQVEGKKHKGEFTLSWTIN